MKIEIPFAPDMKAAALAGKKTCTSRNKKYGVAGDYFQLDDDKDVRHEFVLTSIEPHSLDFVSKNLFKAEGFATPEEFKATWIELHPRKGWVPEQIVFVHHWKEAKP